jgi:glutathione S-transferase
MHTLYYSPAACSLAVHIALEEASLPHELGRFSTREGQTRKLEFLAINPLGQVPALRLPDGQILTQVLALLNYVADLATDRRLLPTGPSERARALATMSFFATTVHGAFRDWIRPEYCVSGESARAAVRETARGRYWEHLGFVEEGLEPGAWILGHTYSLCDAQAYCYYLWGQVFDWPVAELTRYRDLAKRVEERPATQRALAAEGFVGERQLRIG